MSKTLERWYGTTYQEGAPQLPPIGAERLFAAWLEGKSADTIKNYRFDLDVFARFLGAPSSEAAVKILLSRGQGDANLLALEFKNDMLKRGMAPASVNRRLAALRSFTKIARRTGLIAWQVEFDRVYTRPYKDTRGPGVENVRKLLAALRTRNDAVGIRDTAIFRLLYERGLRLKEVQGLDLEHVDLSGGRVFILGKWRHEREWVSLAPTTTAALSRWVDVRGKQHGPLFVGLQKVSGRSEAPGRMSRQAVYRRVKLVGLALGIRVRPHGLRHASITEALDQGIDIRTVARFARHVHLDTIIVYDDSRRDFGKQVTCAIAEPEPGDAPPAVPIVTEPAPPHALISFAPVAPTAHQLGLKRGASNKNAKLTEEKVREIRRRRAEGEGPAALAREFKVSQQQVQNIVKGKSWAHVAISAA